MAECIAARFVIPAGVVVIVMPPRGGSPRAVTNPTPMEFDRPPIVSGPWATFGTPDGGAVRAPDRFVRVVMPERHRVDTHGWRDGDDE
jgi:hypothetical protein